jgi:cellulose synthase/poly-beta-1,6-N-acetylglucosamine synthase-like glycosyltransferase/peptidoglycan/xylan/chitin deacetylase (PgdA/CDA1 family)
MELNHDGGLQVVTAAAGVGTEADNRLVVAAHQHGVRVWPVIQNFPGGVLDRTGLQALGSESSRTELANHIEDIVDGAGADGVNVDLEGLSPRQSSELVAFVTELASVMHQAGKEVVVDVPPDDAAYLNGQLASAADFVLLMAYDQHTSVTEPGPVASRSWSRDALRSIVAQVPASKVIFGMGGYGYDWNGQGATGISYREVLQRAPSAAVINWDASQSAPWFTYAKASGEQHTVWFADATALAVQAVSARAFGAAGTALWRIGDEDPVVWQAIGRDPVQSAAVNLGKVTVDPGLAMHDSNAVGTREIAWGPADGSAVTERYVDLPSSFPAQTGLRAGTVALTFDDGPDPVWTPKILAILRRYGVHATFFVQGARAAAHPELVAQAYAAGNEIGNHSFTHSSNLLEAAPWRLSAEMTPTQRVVEAATGHATTLFRYPYTTEQVFPDPNLPESTRVSQLGYTLVGVGTSTDDWLKPGVVSIVASALNRADANVVLMHDGGGDRSETVAALPQILDGLRSRNLDAVGIGDALGRSRQAAMPTAPASQADSSHLLMTVLTGGSVAWWVFFVATALGFFQFLILRALGIVHWGRARRTYHPPYEGLVSVLVPAHNEEKVICRTLDALVNSDYRSLEIIVIDDGSTDGTAAVVSRYPDSSVRLIQQTHAGKAAALSKGFHAARGEIVICVDADTIFAPAAISALAGPFWDPRVGAVCGNPKVGNKVNLLTRLQSLEYLLSVNLDRRGYALLNCIPVVPGAAGAWRRTAVEASGGFPGDTVTEDMDATICISRAGYRVVYAPKAVAYTEAPQTLRGLHGQRKRWSFGTLQVLWKHRRAALSPGNGSLGLAGLPSLWVGTFVLPFFWPLMYVALGLSSLMSWSPQGLWALVVYNSVVVVFLGWASVLEHEPIANLLLVPVYVIYSQFLQAIALKAVLQAMCGDRVGWNAVGRVGSVSVAESDQRAHQAVAPAHVAEAL